MTVPDFADIDLAEMAFALELEAMAASAARARLEVLAARIGLSRDATAKVLGDWERRARLMHGAHLLVMKLIEDARQTGTVPVLAAAA